MKRTILLGITCLFALQIVSAADVKTTKKQLSRPNRKGGMDQAEMVSESQTQEAPTSSGAQTKSTMTSQKVSGKSTTYGAQGQNAQNMNLMGEQLHAPVGGEKTKHGGAYLPGSPVQPSQTGVWGWKFWDSEDRKKDYSDKDCSDKDCSCSDCSCSDCSCSDCSCSDCSGKDCSGDSNYCSNQCNVNVNCGDCNKYTKAQESLEEADVEQEIVVEEQLQEATIVEETVIEEEPIEIEAIDIQPIEDFIEPVPVAQEQELQEQEPQEQESEECTTFYRRGYSDVGDENYANELQKEWSNEWANEYEDSGMKESVFYKGYGVTVGSGTEYKYDYDSKGVDSGTLDLSSEGDSEWIHTSETFGEETVGDNFESRSETQKKFDSVKDSSSVSKSGTSNSEGTANYKYVEDPECNQYYSLEGETEFKSSNYFNEKTDTRNNYQKSQDIKRFSSKRTECEDSEATLDTEFESQQIEDTQTISGEPQQIEDITVSEEPEDTEVITEVILGEPQQIEDTQPISGEQQALEEGCVESCEFKTGYSKDIKDSRDIGYEHLGEKGGEYEVELDLLWKDSGDSLSIQGMAKGSNEHQWGSSLDSETSTSLKEDYLASGDCTDCGVKSGEHKVDYKKEGKHRKGEFYNFKEDHNVEGEAEIDVGGWTGGGTFSASKYKNGKYSASSGKNYDFGFSGASSTIGDCLDGNCDFLKHRKLPEDSSQVPENNVKGYIEEEVQSSALALALPLAFVYFV